MMSRPHTKNARLFFLSCILSALVYFYFLQSVQRYEHLKLSLCAALLFAAYYYILKTLNNSTLVLEAGLFFRLVLLLSIPNLSQDFYRFLWDGRMVLNGLNPYLFTPKSVINSSEALFPQIQLLYEGMGPLSARHFSNYPPIHQLPFVITALISSTSILGSVVGLRMIIILADIGVFIFGVKLLKALKLPTKNIAYYFLNPLVIIELTGNLHFEGLMLFFLVAAVYFLQQNKILRSGIFMSFSILTKLIPVLFLPLLIQRLGRKNSLRYFGVIILCSVLFTLPFFEVEFLKNYSNTIGLWFTNFEFNSSIFALSKKLMLQIFNQNLMKYMPFIAPLLMSIVLLCFVRLKKTTTAGILHLFLWVLTIYYLCSTTIHPWYICALVLLCCFTKYRFALVWSGTIFLSYFAYQQDLVSDNSLWEAVEYFSVGAYMLYELSNAKGLRASSSS